MNSKLRVRGGVIAATFAVVAGTSLLLAPSASADQVWFHSVGRADATAECPKSTEVEVAAGWSQWAGSWEEWPNGGKGGYVCSRQITWAFDSPRPGAAATFAGGGCRLYDNAFNSYIDFGDGFSVPSNTAQWIDGPTCSGEPDSLFTGFDVVYAPAGTDADARCEAAFPGTVAVAPGVVVSGWAPDPDVYPCVVLD